MVKGIEKYGIPVVHMATVVPISLTIGANRIIPGIGIPYPLGDPPQGEKDSYKLRLSMVRRARLCLRNNTEMTNPAQQAACPLRRHKLGQRYGAVSDHG